MPCCEQRLAYSHAGLARLCEWLVPRGHVFSEEAGPDLFKLSQTDVSCTGVWGDVDDVRRFLTSYVKLSAVSVRKVGLAWDCGTSTSSH